MNCRHRSSQRMIRCWDSGWARGQRTLLGSVHQIKCAKGGVHLIGLSLAAYSFSSRLLRIMHPVLRNVRHIPAVAAEPFLHLTGRMESHGMCCFQSGKHSGYLKSNLTENKACDGCKGKERLQDMKSICACKADIRFYTGQITLNTFKKQSLLMSLCAVTLDPVLHINTSASPALLYPLTVLSALCMVVHRGHKAWADVWWAYGFSVQRPTWN